MVRIEREPSKTFSQDFSIFLEERIRSCDYYYNGTYDAQLSRSLALSKELQEKMGEDKFRELWDLFFEIESITGEKLASLSESSYQQGFNDALFLVGQIERAKNGEKDIFRVSRED